VAKPRIGIGITTYRKLAEPEIGGAVFDAYAAASPRIVPNRIDVWSERHPVAGRDDFARHWLTIMGWEQQEERGGPVTARGEHRVGATWRHVGAPVGEGKVTFRRELDPKDADRIEIGSAWSPRVDWLVLFRALCAICRPAHAALHLYTDREGALLDAEDRQDYFERPVTGETAFTAWRTPLDTWRKPDACELEKRRDYRFLPQLFWANHLGPEFSIVADRAFLAANACHVEEGESGLLFTVTEALADVDTDFERFRYARAALRHAFAPGTLRIEEPLAS
jgi:hypothetical protein